MKIHTGQSIFDGWFAGKLTAQGCSNLAPYLNQLEQDRANAIVLVHQAIEAGFTPKSFVNENDLAVSAISGSPDGSAPKDVTRSKEEMSAAANIPEKIQCSECHGKGWIWN